MVQQSHALRLRKVMGIRSFLQCKGEGCKPGKDVDAAFGRTNGNRLLSVFFVYTRDRRVIIVSARDMSEKERRRYAK